MYVVFTGVDDEEIPAVVAEESKGLEGGHCEARIRTTTVLR